MIDLRPWFNAKGVVLCLMVLTVWFLPISSSAKSIFLPMAVAVVLLSPSYHLLRQEVFQRPWAIAAFSVVGLALLACLWSPASFAEKWLVVSKYAKLLSLPFLAIGFFHAQTRRLSVLAFISMMTLLCLVAIIKFWGGFASLAIEPDHLFRNHIMTGLMVSFALYIVLWYVTQTRNRVEQLFALLLAAIFTYDMFFINQGRTGYVMTALMWGLFITHSRDWWKIGFGCIILALLSIVIYFNSPVVQVGVNSVIAQVEHGSDEAIKNGSIGLRLQFHAVAKARFLAHPLMGNGTASFTHYFRTNNPVPAWGENHVLLEPHSQYWLQASEWGLLGLLALVAVVLTVYLEARQVIILKPIAFALLLLFVVGNLSDSLLFYSGSGYFFILFAAMGLGAALERRKPMALGFMA